MQCEDSANQSELGLSFSVVTTPYWQWQRGQIRGAIGMQETRPSGYLPGMGRGQGERGCGLSSQCHAGRRQDRRQKRLLTEIETYNICISVY